MKITPCAALLSAALLASSGAAQNLLTNADFEAGLTGWTAFGNAQPATANPPEIDPLSGTQLCKLFGNFSGGFDVSGIFQAFPATPGQSFTMDSWSRHWSGDPVVGGGPPGDNWCVMKIAFFDAANVEIGGAEGTVIDGNSPTDTWIDNTPVTGVAPAGTTSVQALILFLQPGNVGGAAQVDDIEFTTSAPPAPPTGNLLANGGFETGLDGWSVFGNAFAEATNPPEIQPRTGSQVCKLFGNFTGGFDVSGIFQTFGAEPGQSFTMDAWSRHWSGDPLIGAGPPGDNWMVMKIAFFDAANAEIGASEAIICDGNTTTDTWIDNSPISGVAPPGTVSVQALILFLQPANAGGGAQVDDIEFTTNSNCDIAENGGFETGDLTGWDVFPSAPGQVTVNAPGNGSGFAVNINNTVLASAALIKNANIGLGNGWPNPVSVQPGDNVTISFDARGTTMAGGVAFAEFFSELSGGGTSAAEILGGAPLALDPDPMVWTSFSFTTTTGPDVSGGVTVQLTATTGGAPGSMADLYYDNLSVIVERVGPTWTNYGAGFAGTNGEPSLGLDGNPIVGQTVNVLAGNASGLTVPAVILFGDQQLDLPTPFGGSLLNNAVVPVNLPTLAPAGGSVPLGIPSNPALCGAELYGQLIHADPGSATGLAFSRGLRIIFGGV